MTAPDPLALVGTTVSEKYEIERAVGEGGFATVYRARHTVWNRPVAIKVFRALGDLGPDRRKALVDSFIQEGRLLVDLSERSAAICQARDVGTLRANDGREIPYMVLEWLEGSSLEEVIERDKAAGIRPRSLEETVALLEPVAEALALAHKKGVAHRDVKPANIFVVGDPRGERTVKLLDFGIAKVVQDAQRMGGSFERTQGGITSFTPAYAAPEQFDRGQGTTGPWTDVFALALIVTELVSHQPPLTGDDLTQLAFASINPQRRPTPRGFGVLIPDAVETVLLRALAVSPDERFRSMAEFWSALRASLGMEPSRAFMADASNTAPFSLQRPSAVAGDPNVRATVPTGSAGPIASPGVGAPAPRPVDATVRRDVPAARSSSLGLFVGLGAGVIALAGGVIGGVWYFAIRGRDPVALASVDAGPPVSVAPASASASAAPPPVTCPAGMVTIAAGKYFMGTDDKNDNEDERPAHQVTLSPYCIDRTEVSVAAYKACSDRGECKRAPIENEWEGIDAASRKIYDPLCNARDPETRGEHPVNCIDWSLASAFCSATGRRLPTEAEWEYATRGSDGRKYPWGDDPPMRGDFLNACGKECVAWGRKHPDPNSPLVAMYQADDGFPTTAPVGSFPKGASPFGVEDVVGNVWEWVADWYAPYTDAASSDPKGPESGTDRVMRGGSWNGSDVAWVRPTFRFKSTPALRSHGIGFRCAKSLEPAK